MANVFQSVSTVVQRMLDNYKAITGITLNLSQLDDSTVIKLFTMGGAVSSFTSQLQGSYNDMFPTSASEPALELHLATRSLPPRSQPQSSNGQIQLSSQVANTAGLVFPTGAQITRTSDGTTFTSIQSGTTDGTGTVLIYFQADDEGNSTNLDALNDPFTLTTPVTGFATACFNTTEFLDGSDLETPAEMLARILAHDQDENSGGNIAAYEAWALAASPAVVTAKTVKLLRGPSTVDTYITSGTTDISAAVLAGQPVVRIPSAALIATVQAYITSLNPITDIHQTDAPTESAFNVTVNFDLYTETTANRAYVSNIVNQQVAIYLYSALSGNTIYPTELERIIDQVVGDQLQQRHVGNFGGSNAEYTIPNGTILKPGTITIGTIA